MTVTGSYCRYCGTRIEPNSKFCSNCGKPTSLPAAAAPVASSSDTRAEKKKDRKVIAVIVIIVLFVTIGAVYAAISSASTQRTLMNNASNNPTQQTEDRIAQLLGNDPERMNDRQWRQVATDILSTENTDNGLLVIHSDTGWHAVVQDSNFVQTTIDGFGPRSIEFECGTFGIFSHVVQKDTDTGVLNVYVAQNGHIVKQANTGAAYGVVSIAGNCEG